MAGEIACYRYCLVGTLCSSFGQETVAVPITVYESTQDDGYPDIYDELMPGLYNNVNPPGPGSVIYYLIDINDPNFPYPGFLARAIYGGLCSEPTGFSCDIEVGGIVIDPNTIEVVTTLPEGSSCPTTDCFTLTNCAKPTESIIVSDMISVYQGMVVALQEYPGKLWFVGEPSICANELNFVTVVETYANCQDALPPVVEQYTRIEPKADRNFSAITVSEQDIRDNVRFANSYYDLFRSLKHGINNFCDNLTLEKTWMRKELSDMNQLLDPTICTIPTPVVPVVCAEPEGNPIPPETPAT